MRTEATLAFAYDPMCGWCYAVAPVVDALVRSLGDRVSLRMLHVGLFAGDGARPQSIEFARFAWSNDQRIAALTGQPFSETYRTRVLWNPRVRTDSWPAALAMQLIAAARPDREVAALHAIQRMRFVDGRDVTEPSTLAEVAREVGVDTSTFEELLANPVIAERADRAAADGRALVESVGAHGVPVLALLGNDGTVRRLPHEDWLGNPARAAASVAGYMPSARIGRIHTPTF
jgi:putative protein-disulfide isomerase